MCKYGRRYGHRLRFVSAISVLAILVQLGSWMIPGRVAADNGFHQYSHAWENTSGWYTAFQLSRYDVNVLYQPSTGCGSPWSGDPIYQTMWLYLNSGSNAQVLELGTGHQCNSTYNYWFWDYENNNVWYLIGYRTGITLWTNHAFQISSEYNGSVYKWNWRIDGNAVYNQMTTSGIGNHLDAGLESYSSGAVVDALEIGPLRYQSYWGAWTNWSGQDGSQVNTPAMCGHWDTAIYWAYAEHESPC
jgi:hypothetical protein